MREKWKERYKQLWDIKEKYRIGCKAAMELLREYKKANTIDELSECKKKTNKLLKELGEE